MELTMRRFSVGVALLLAVAFICSGVSPASGRGEQSGDLVSVIIGTSGDSGEASAAIEASGGIVDRSFSLIPAVEARVPLSALAALSEDPSVTTIVPNASLRNTDSHDDDEPPNASSVFDDAIRADLVVDSGVDGDGIGIAFIDTGVVSHGGTDLSGRVVKSVVFGAEKTEDEFGHGTHAAGVAAGDGDNSRDDEYRGIAPRADIISVKVGDGRSAHIGDAVAGLEWVVANKDRYNIRVVNISLTSNTVMSYRKDPLAAAAEQAWFSGLVVVVSAGNRGSDPYTVDHAPANDPFVISVGAFSDNLTAWSGDDYLKSWSSRGISHDGIAKPDLIAPGSRLIAFAGHEDTDLYDDYPQNRVGDKYFQLSGTSFSAPIVSGVVALMLDEQPQLTPDEVKARLLSSASPMSGSAAPRVDAWDAVFGDFTNLEPANQGIVPSLWIDPSTGLIDPAQLDGFTWDGITWDGFTWDGFTWDGFTWDGFTWDGFTWDGFSWDGFSWDGFSWDTIVE